MDPLLWVMGLFGAGAALGSKKEKEPPGADFGKDVSSVPHYGILTPARQEFYERAMLETKGPQAFKDLADDFEKVGLKEEAKNLRARGDARAVGLDVHEKRREIIRQCLDSEDPMVCEEGADICEKLGMTIAARELRSYATGLREKATLALSQQQAAAEGAAAGTAAPAAAAGPAPEAAPPAPAVAPPAPAAAGPAAATPVLTPTVGSAEWAMAQLEANE